MPNCYKKFLLQHTGDWWYETEAAAEGRWCCCGRLAGGREVAAPVWWRGGSLLPVLSFSTTNRVRYQCFKKFWVYLSIKWWYTDIVFLLDGRYNKGEILILPSGKKAKWHQWLMPFWHLPTSQNWCSRFLLVYSQCLAFHMNTYLRKTCYHLQIQLHSSFC